MSLHHYLLPSFTPSLSFAQPHLNGWTRITPGAMASPASKGIARWGSSVLFPLLLSPLMTSCTVEKIAAPTQGPTNPAQATERTPRVSTAPESIKTKTKGEIPAAPPQPSQQIPQLMSQASSTANNELFTTEQSGSHQGPLRIGNQTEHPLRIAFLAQSEAPADADPSAESALESATELDNPEATSPATNSPETASTLREPFHWDFAPAEGGRNGLLLALPEGDLSLQDGDVVVAFAQDGSQRYWGPYVVGKTSLPHWNGDRNEWQLLVQP